MCTVPNCELIILDICGLALSWNHAHTACTPDWKCSRSTRPPVPPPYSSDMFSRKWSSLKVMPESEMSRGYRFAGKMGKCTESVSILWSTTTCMARNCGCGDGYYSITTYTSLLCQPSYLDYQTSATIHELWLAMQCVLLTHYVHFVQDYKERAPANLQ